MDKEQRISRIFLSYREMNQAFYHVMMKVAQQHGITPIQLIVLRILKENPRIGLSELSDKMKMGSSACSGIVDRMVKAGMVSRSRSGEDRRAVHISLTDKGNKLWEETDATRERMFLPLLDLPEKDQDELLRIQHEILRILKQVREEVHHG